MTTDTHKNGGPDHSKEITIIVNGRQKTVTEKEMSFDEIVTLAFGTPDYEQNVYTVNYFRHEGKENKEASLVTGQTVHVKDGMIFTVVRTTRS
jgi:hypothetical protein